ncbi:MAG: DinB family protein [Propionibacteriaceae bacterium]|jgi:uncharacterized damage-inducible protein DinB|nr:DinB family protein [Propionibacteriaceae bacterium]
MSHSDLKATLADALDQAHDVVLWKLAELGERDLRRPLTPTGSNLLGIVKHLATVEYGYFGDVFGRPPAEPAEWLHGDDDNADMYCTAAEDTAWVTGFYRRANAHAAATIAALELDSPGSVPWWGPEPVPVTLGQILVHMLAETNRHAGQMDILRELTDGQTGWQPARLCLPRHDQAWWDAYLARLQALSDTA